MYLDEAIKKRQAVREYLEKDVPEDAIKKILELANLSPSAGNLQARRVVIVKDPALRENLKATCSGLGRFSIAPPVILAICSVPEESAIKYADRGRNLYALQDATIFAAYVQLTAVSLGLASCWVGSFNEKEVSEILQLPEGIIPVALIPVGFTEEAPREKSRKTLEEIIIKEI
ncbi:MAG: nitroreductase family protein [Candidatus Daviesbacteria bacterium]|nr:nitroreductase family protein [Candidatus Daviesbacteria bacterium]